MIILVTGPARSGKSEWAETLALNGQKTVTYIPTAQENKADLEWQARIQRHQQRRPGHWYTQHCPESFDDLLVKGSSRDCLLIDSLGTWVSNYLERPEPDWQRVKQTMLEALMGTAAQVIFVAEETGWGVVPAYPLGRLFRDRLGEITRQIGAIADDAYLVCAGFAVNLKQIGQIVESPNFER